MNELRNKGVFYTSVWLATVFLLALSPAGYTAKGGKGKGGGKPGGGDEPPVQQGCTGNFPALVYHEVRRHPKNGRVVGHDVVLTNAVASEDCRIVVSNTQPDPQELSLSQVGDTYRLIWGDYLNDTSVILAAEFTVSEPDENGLISINEPLPLPTNIIYSYAGPYANGGASDLDVEGNELVFSREHGEFLEGTYVYVSEILHIGDISACLAAAAASNVGDSCAAIVTPAIPSSEFYDRWHPSFSDDRQAIFYLTHEAADDVNYPDFDRDEIQHLSMVVKIGSGWSTPQLVLTDMDLGQTNGVFGAVNYPSYGEIGGRSYLAYRLRDLNPDSSSIRLVALDGPNGSCEPTVGLESCVAIGTAELVEDLWLMSNTSDPVIDWVGSKVMRLSANGGSIEIWDTSTGSVTTLVSSDGIYDFDPL